MLLHPMMFRRVLLLLLLLWGGIPSTRSAAEDTAQIEPARFHHVRLNATNPRDSIRFYSRVFGAVPVKFRDRQDALFTERSFILFNQVETPPDSKLNTGIWHIGWGGVDVESLYNWWAQRGVKFQTPLSPLPGPNNHYMYISGPDEELIEVNTMGHHRFGHVHFFATDVNETVAWYRDHLGLKPRAAQVRRPTGDPAQLSGIWMNMIQCDNVNMIFFGKPDHEPAVPWWPDEPLREIQPTDGHAINHIAFSYRDIQPVYERMRAAGVKIEREPAEDPTFGFRSFSVRGPDGVLIEIVQAKPIPEGIWDDE